MLPLEDSYLDIIGKAQRGLKLSNSDLSHRASLEPTELEKIQNGETTDHQLLAKIAPVLGLGAQELIDAAAKTWHPQPVEVEGLRTFTTNFEDMTVNSYLVWEGNIAVAFDTGADAGDMLDFAAAQGLNISQILITHTHGDHIFDLDRLKEKTGAPAYVGDKEPPIDGAEPFAAGKMFQVGSLTIESRLTWGHAQGGITYFIKGLSRPVAIVGDAIFAGSMGGGMVSYADALRTNREQILTLPDDTVLGPGHGPLTTVAEQKSHNPFFTA
ncbi:hypothetical protein BH09VER1_BH09VER1_38130 [soil metagenome]